jgi:hypothetical protein
MIASRLSKGPRMSDDAVWRMLRRVVSETGKAC